MKILLWKWEMRKKIEMGKFSRDIFFLLEDKIKYVALFSHGIQSGFNLFICFLICNLLLDPFHSLYLPVPILPYRKLSQWNLMEGKFSEAKRGFCEWHCDFPYRQISLTAFTSFSIWKALFRVKLFHQHAEQLIKLLYWIYYTIRLKFFLSLNIYLQNLSSIELILGGKFESQNQSRRWKACKKNLCFDILMRSSIASKWQNFQKRL